MYHFVTWNTKPDASGIDITRYGECKGPVTFYAIYYQSDYAYTGSYQVFTAPVAGWYKVQLWGAKGGGDLSRPDGGGNGGYTTGEIKLKRGELVYVYVGFRGSDEILNGINANGFNGGGFPTTASGSGGGATDIRMIGGAWNNWSSLCSRILVAGGGGGAGSNSDGGYGGGLTGGSSVGGGGGTQYGGGFGAIRGSFGAGAQHSGDGGGGGGGYYGGGAGARGHGGHYINGGAADQGGGGGSSYIGGYGSAIVRNAQTIPGNQTMPSFSGGYMVGNTGPCYATFRLVERLN